jgi:hypothetical protein
MIERLTIGDGQWMDVKAKLKVRDTRMIHSYSVDGMSSDGKTYRFNIVKHGIATAAARITFWDGFKDDDGKPIPYPAGKSFEDRIATIESLDEDDFGSITKAMNERFNKTDEVPEKNEPTANS